MSKTLFTDTEIVVTSTLDMVTVLCTIGMTLLWFHLFIHSLNETITSLLVQGNISSSEWQTLSVVVALDPFAMPRSFIVQVCTSKPVPFCSTDRFQYVHTESNS